MSDLMLGFCEPLSCIHECNCSCHRPSSAAAREVHIVECCNECGLCGRNIKTVFKSAHNENCHKPVSKKMPAPKMPIQNPKLKRKRGM